MKRNILDIVTTSNSNVLEVFVLDDPLSDHYPVNITDFVENIQSTSKFSTLVYSKSAFDKLYFNDFLGPTYQFLHYSLDFTAHDQNFFYHKVPKTQLQKGNQKGVVNFLTTFRLIVFIWPTSFVRL